MKQSMAEQITAQLIESCKAELKKELHAEVWAALYEELRDEVWAELEEDLTPTLMAQLAEIHFSEIYDMEQIATFLSVDKRTVNREINRGKMKAHKINNIYRIRREDLDAYMRSIVVQPKDEKSYHISPNGT